MRGSQGNLAERQLVISGGGRATAESPLADLQAR